MPRATQDDDRLRAASHTGLSPSSVQLSRWFRSQTLLPQLGPTTPGRPEPPGFGLIPGRSPLLGESLTYFLFLRVLRCFSSPRSPQPKGCPIRKSADQRPFAPTRGLSQLVTSFIACESLGIRHTPFDTFARTELAKKGKLG